VPGDLAFCGSDRLIIPAKELIGRCTCFRCVFARNVSVKASGTSPGQAVFRSTF
jgi:hypothetical protein